jgi:hypothetical protein
LSRPVVADANGGVEWVRLGLDGAAVTFAIALWVARSVALGLLALEHVSQVVRARRRKAEGAWVWALPIATNWGHGDRAGPTRWVLLAAAYLATSLASEMVR